MSGVVSCHTLVVCYYWSAVSSFNSCISGSIALEQYLNGIPEDKNVPVDFHVATMYTMIAEQDFVLYKVGASFLASFSFPSLPVWLTAQKQVWSTAY